MVTSARAVSWSSMPASWTYAELGIGGPMPTSRLCRPVGRVSSGSTAMAGFSVLAVLIGSA
jgi:hypothetical protein